LQNVDGIPTSKHKVARAVSHLGKDEAQFLRTFLKICHRQYRCKVVFHPLRAAVIALSPSVRKT